MNILCDEKNYNFDAHVECKIGIRFFFSNTVHLVTGLIEALYLTSPMYFCMQVCYRNVELLILLWVYVSSVFHPIGCSKKVSIPLCKYNVDVNGIMSDFILCFQRTGTLNQMYFTCIDFEPL